MKNKVILVSLLVIILGIGLFVLTGCTQNYGLDDIKNYVEKNIGIKDYTIKERYTEVKDKDGYNDYYWHIRYNQIDFDVIDNYYYGMESISNRLEDNFKEKVLDYYYGKYSEASKITYKKDYIYTKNTLICVAADDQGVIDETKLKENYDNLVSFINTIDFKTYPIDNISVGITSSSKHIKWTSIYKDNKICTLEEFKKGN